MTRGVGEWRERLGDEGATESKLAEAAREVLGEGGISFISASLCSIMVGETDISGVSPEISMPREPVDESRTLIRDTGTVGEDVEVDSATFGRVATPGFA
jgi:hypothetical protein